MVLDALCRNGGKSVLKSIIMQYAISVLTSISSVLCFKLMWFAILLMALYYGIKQSKGCSADDDAQGQEAVLGYSGSAPEGQNVPMCLDPTDVTTAVVRCCADQCEGENANHMIWTMPDAQIHTADMPIPNACEDSKGNTTNGPCICPSFNTSAECAAGGSLVGAADTNVQSSCMHVKCSHKNLVVFPIVPEVSSFIKKPVCSERDKGRGWRWRERGNEDLDE